MSDQVTRTVRTVLKRFPAAGPYGSWPAGRVRRTEAGPGTARPGRHGPARRRLPRHRRQSRSALTRPLPSAVPAAVGARHPCSGKVSDHDVPGPRHARAGHPGTPCPRGGCLYGPPRPALRRQGAHPGRRAVGGAAPRPRRPRPRQRRQTEPAPQLPAAPRIEQPLPLSSSIHPNTSSRPGRCSVVRARLHPRRRRPSHGCPGSALFHRSPEFGGTRDVRRVHRLLRRPLARPTPAAPPRRRPVHQSHRPTAQSARRPQHR